MRDGDFHRRQLHVAAELALVEEIPNPQGRSLHQALEIGQVRDRGQISQVPLEVRRDVGVEPEGAIGRRCTRITNGHLGESAASRAGPPGGWRGFLCSHHVEPAGD
ncbi:MAG: hypothetical protein ACREU3_14355 [Steroidobacteraceae bacterium]